MTKCSVDGCVKPCHAIGFCNTHYKRNRVNSEVNDPVRPYFKKASTDCFWDFSDIDERTGCMNWKGKIRRGGYGVYSLKGKQLSAHRFAYQLEFGFIPVGLLVLHRCDNRLCVNPSHLFVGTNDDNVADMIAKGRNNPNAKISLDEADVIRKLNMQPKYIAECFGVSIPHIRDVISGKYRVRPNQDGTYSK